MGHFLFQFQQSHKHHAALVLALLLGASTFTSGCGPVSAFGVGAVTITSGAQERGLGGVVNDAEIHSKINLRFFDYHVDLFKRLNVTVYDGRVLITGSVPNKEAREDAIAIARQVGGVREVLDEIRIGPPLSPDAYLLDSWIANQIRTTLLVMAQVQSGNYTVDVEDQVVYLMGIAQDNDEMERVIQVAQDTPDVIKVVSYIQIKPPATMPPVRVRGEETMGKAPVLPGGAAPVASPMPAGAAADAPAGWLPGQVVDPEVNALPAGPVDLTLPPPETVNAHPVGTEHARSPSAFIE